MRGWQVLGEEMAFRAVVEGKQLRSRDYVNKYKDAMSAQVRLSLLSLEGWPSLALLPFLEALLPFLEAMLPISGTLILLSAAMLASLTATLTCFGRRGSGGQEVRLFYKNKGKDTRQDYAGGARKWSGWPRYNDTNVDTGTGARCTLRVCQQRRDGFLLLWMRWLCWQCLCLWMQYRCAWRQCLCF